MEALINLIILAVNAFSKLNMAGQDGNNLLETPLTISETNGLCPSLLTKFQHSLKNMSAEDMDLHKIMENVTLPESGVNTLGIFDSQFLSIGIFVLHPGAKIPLHDHPNMFGFLKVLHGKVRVTSFNLYNSVPSSFGEATVKAKISAKDCLSKYSQPAVLSPIQDNIHEIRFESGEDGKEYAAFLDILTPSYYGGNKEFYYKHIDNTTISNRFETDLDDVYYIERSHLHPPDFFTVEINFPNVLNSTIAKKLGLQRITQ